MRLVDRLLAAGGPDVALADVAALLVVDRQEGFLHTALRFGGGIGRDCPGAGQTTHFIVDLQGADVGLALVVRACLWPAPPFGSHAPRLVTVDVEDRVLNLVGGGRGRGWPMRARAHQTRCLAVDRQRGGALARDHVRHFFNPTLTGARKATHFIVDHQVGILFTLKLRDLFLRPAIPSTGQATDFLRHVKIGSTVLGNDVAAGIHMPLNPAHLPCRFAIDVQQRTLVVVGDHREGVCHIFAGAQRFFTGRYDALADEFFGRGVTPVATLMVGDGVFAAAEDLPKQVPLLGSTYGRSRGRKQRLILSHRLDAIIVDLGRSLDDPKGSTLGAMQVAVVVCFFLGVLAQGIHLGAACRRLIQFSLQLV